MKYIKNIIVSNTEPTTDSIWVQGDNNSVLFKIYFNGSWRVINKFDTSDLEGELGDMINQALEDKQDKSDILLNTTNKTIVGAINLINTEVNSNKGEITNIKQQYAKKTEIPKSTSQLENDSNYITEIPSDLVTEQELLDKNYVTQPSLQSSLALKQDVIIAGNGVSIENNTISVILDNTIFKVVSSLPERPEAQDSNKIFLVLAETKAEPSVNLYTEYLFVNDKWEPLGTYSSAVDLTPYITKEEATQQFEPKFNHNTAFNKSFGTTADTVCEGNDSRLSDDRNPRTHKQAYTASELTDYTADDPSYGATPAAVKKGIETFAALKNGTNATGDWNINITGSAENASKLENIPLKDIYGIHPNSPTSESVDLNNILSPYGIKVFSYSYEKSAVVSNKPEGDLESSARSVFSFNASDLGYSMQLSPSYHNDNLYIRTKYQDSWYAWRQLAYTHSTVAASKRIVPHANLGNIDENQYTVGQIKQELLKLLKNQPTGIGDTIIVPGDFIRKWHEEDHKVSPNGNYSIIKIAGGYHSGTFGQWICTSYDNSPIYILGINNSQFSFFEALTFSSGNIESANKLHTSRTIFGQPFDGTANVEGDANIANLTVTGTLNAPVLGDINTALTKILGE